MSERSLFFNSAPDDRRKYNSSDFADFMKIFYATGIIAGGDRLRVTKSADALRVYVAPGQAVVEGRMYELTGEPLPLSVPAADPTYARLDRVILRLDLTISVRNVHVQILPGTPAAIPLPPELVRNNNYYDLSLAQLRIPPGSLTVDTVTDERYDLNVCGICYGLYTLDLSDFMEMDFGYFPTPENIAALAAHESANVAHRGLRVDGAVGSAGMAKSLEEHIKDAEAHPNIELDGNEEG